MPLPNRPRFVFGATDFTLALPYMPWDITLLNDGGDIESDAGVRAAFIICSYEALTLPLRVFEDEWSLVQQLIDYGQSGEEFTWYPDAFDNTIAPFSVTLVSPEVGSSYEATPDGEFPRMLRISITIMQPECAFWNIESVPPPPVITNFFDPGDGEFEITDAEEGAVLTVLLVGGGGGGGGNGGGGGDVMLTTIPAIDGVYGYHVGQGGAPGFAGTSTQLNLLFVSPGGPSGAFGGSSGSGQPGGEGTGAGSSSDPPDGSGVSSGGGGGGASGPGGNSISTPGDPPHGLGGNGGSGVLTDFGSFGGGGGGGVSTVNAGIGSPGGGGLGGGGAGGFNSPGGPAASRTGGGGGGGAAFGGGNGANGRVTLIYAEGAFVLIAIP